MKHTLRFLSFLLLISGSLSHAQQIYRWRAETTDPKPADFPVFQGEYITLQPTLYLYGVALSLPTNATAALYYQTNGMGAAWWTFPASITTAGVATVNWVPTNDVGASSYTWFLSVTSSSATTYRAYGRLRMLSSPGYSPTAAPPPQYQWISPAELLAVSNALAAAVQIAAGTASSALVAASNAQSTADAAATPTMVGATSALDRAYAASVAAQARTNALADLAAAAALLSVADARRLVESNTNSWISVQNGTGVLHTASSASTLTITRPSADYYGPADGTVFYLSDTNAPRVWTNGLFAIQEADVDEFGTNGWVMYDPPPALWGPWDMAEGSSTTLPVRVYNGDNGSIEISASVQYPLATETGTVIRISAHNADPLSHPDRPTFDSVTNIASAAAGSTNAAHLAATNPHPQYATPSGVSNIVSAYSIPTNVVLGWRVWDSGSNRFWTVVATNLRFYVLE